MNTILPLRRPGAGRGTGPHPGYGFYQPGKLMWWHDAIIDEMLQNPQLTKKEIALKLRCTVSFLYAITASDLFTARWEQRRNQHSENVGLALLGKLNKTAEKTLDRILDQLEDTGKSIPLNQLESLADKTLGRLGYGPKQPIQPPSVMVANTAAVQVIVPATRDELDAARALILKNERELALSSLAKEGLEPPLPGQNVTEAAKGAILDGIVSDDGSVTP